MHLRLRKGNRLVLQKLVTQRSISVLSTKLETLKIPRHTLLKAVFTILIGYEYARVTLAYLIDRKSILEYRSVGKTASIDRFEDFCRATVDHW